MRSTDGKLMSDWISVGDRLPGKYNRVLVTNGFGVCIGIQQSAIDSLIYCSQYCDCDCHANANDDYAITHWMPLPKPPKIIKE